MMKDAQKLMFIQWELMDAQDNLEITDIVQRNKDFLDEHPLLYRNVRNARKRVNTLRKLKFKLEDIIYLN